VLGWQAWVTTPHGKNLAKLIKMHMILNLSLLIISLIISFQYLWKIKSILCDCANVIKVLSGLNIEDEYTSCFHAFNKLRFYFSQPLFG
jgi:hypothetical protein